MTAEIVQTLLAKARDGIGLVQAITEVGVAKKETLLYMRQRHREDYKAAKREGAPKALQRFREARAKRGKA